MKTPARLAELSINGPYLGFARGRARGVSSRWPARPPPPFNPPLTLLPPPRPWLPSLGAPVPLSLRAAPPLHAGRGCGPLRPCHAAVHRLGPFPACPRHLRAIATRFLPSPSPARPGPAQLRVGTDTLPASVRLRPVLRPREPARGGEPCGGGCCCSPQSLEGKQVGLCRVDQILGGGRGRTTATRTSVARGTAVNGHGWGQRLLGAVPSQSSLATGSALNPNPVYRWLRLLSAKK